MSTADEIGVELATFISKVAGEFGATLVESLREANPKKTSHSAFNWIGSVGQPFRGVAGSNESPSKSEQDAGIVALRGYHISQGSFFVTNNVHYVPIIDAIGPHAGFIRRGLEAAISIVETRFV